MFFKHRPEDCVKVYKPEKAYNGCTVFANHFNKEWWLINMKGQIVHHWDMPSPTASGVSILPNGNHLRISKTGIEPTANIGSVGSDLVEVDWEGNVVWKYVDPYMHHDYHLMANGNFMLNRHVPIPPEIAAKLKGGIPETELEDGSMYGNGHHEIDRDGNVLWNWVGYEHFDPEIESCPLCPRSCWDYVNGIDVFPNGDVLASVRFHNTLIRIDKNTGDIKWTWGAWELGHQHDPSVLENGNVLVFNNNYHGLPEYEHRRHVNVGAFSRILEIDPITDEIVWEYRDPIANNFFSPVCGSAQRLPNGNTLICESTKGRLFEVTPDKEVVWEFISPVYEYRQRTWGWTNLIFKAARYGYDYPGFKDKNLDPSQFEFIVRKKDSPATKEAKGDQEILRARLANLGY